jgi:hypothetical protein
MQLNSVIMRQDPGATTEPEAIEQNMVGGRAFIARKDGRHGLEEICYKITSRGSKARLGERNTLLIPHWL